MKADQLKALQAPIKERYRNDPAAAVVTLRAQGRIGEGIACRVDTARASIEAGLHAATGGSGLQACDFRGTLGVARDAPVGFREVRLKFDLQSDATQEQLGKLLELTERYCVVLQTIRNAPAIAVSR